MNTDIAGFPAFHPILRILVSFPIACFSGALATDIAYAVTTDMMWADFSAWLLAAGMAFGFVAGAAALVHLIRYRRAWAPRPVSPILIGSLLVLILATFDNLVHSRDAWTSVVPAGLALSILTFVVMIATVWRSASPGYRQVEVRR